MSNHSLTVEQEICYEIITKDIDEVINSINDEEHIMEGKFHFIQGKAGVGKTEFHWEINYRKIIGIYRNDSDKFR